MIGYVFGASAVVFEDAGFLGERMTGIARGSGALSFMLHQ